MQLHGTLSIQELFKNGLISRAAYTICSREQLTDLDTIALYQSRFKNFLSIRNCGDTTNEVLQTLCRQWERVTKSQRTLPTKETVTRPLTPAERWEALTEEQQQDTQNRYEVLRSRLSKRAGNKLLTLCGGATTATALATLLSTHLTAAQRHLLSPNNISGAELLSLVTEFTGFLEKPRSVKDAGASLLGLLRSRMSQIVLSYPTSPIGRFLKEEFATLSNGDFPLLRFAHLFLQDCHFAPQNLKDAFLQLATWYDSHKEKPAEEIATEFGYTVQSLRSTLQKEKTEQKLLRRLGDAIALLKPFGFVVPSAFVLSGVSYQIFSGVEEESPFNRRFIISLITLLNPGYKAARLHTKDGRIWAFFPKQVLEKFDATGFSASVVKLLVKRTPTERVLSLNSLVVPFYTTAVTDDENSRLFSIASLLLEDLYRLHLDAEECLHLPATRAPFFAEQIYDILTRLNKPCHVRDITELLREKGIYTTTDNMRPHLQHNKQFILMGSSMYGLKEWEKRGAVGGTIKQLIKKFLEEAGEPKHIQEIINWVTMHRSSNPESIRSNIQHDPKGWFRFFGNGFYGLSGRRYKNTRYKHIKTSWLHHVKLLYAKAGSNPLPKTTVVEFITRLCGVTSVQVERLLHKHISKGTFEVKDDYLVLLPAPVVQPDHR